MAARCEWEATHKPDSIARLDQLSATELSHMTTAPIKHCTPVEDDAGNASSPPLHFLRQRYVERSRHPQLVRRVRLLFNRSYTATVRLYFPSGAMAPADGGDCPHPDCRIGDDIRCSETIRHLLLDCHYYDDARDQLRRVLADHGLLLTLHTVLNPYHKHSRTFLELYKATNRFLDSVDATRQQSSLPALDMCPIFPTNTAVTSPAAARLARRRARTRRRGRVRQAASAVPPHRDTG
jgi:hypothetical protein